MRVAVVGAGVIGVTTAWELAEDGHEVTVFERHGTVAAETSYANAGVVAPGYVTPWAAPGMPKKVLQHLWHEHAPVRINARLDAATLRWIWRWRRACTSEGYLANRGRLLRLARYSRERLHVLTRDQGLAYEGTDGVLVLLRSEQDLALARPGLSLLAETGLHFSLVDAAKCRRLEPGLNPDTPLLAGIHLPEDEVGNCREFTHLLRGKAHHRGVQFMFHTQVQRLRAGPQPQITHVHLDNEPAPISGAAEAASREGPSTRPMPQEPRTDRYDAVVICAALGSRALLRPLGLRLPLAPVYGYSVTLPVRHYEAHPDTGPRSAVMDERYKVAISRLGERIRIAGGAELGGRPDRFNTAAIDTLYKVLDDWFPGSVHLARAQPWKGARPMLPDGPPVIGASGSDGIWLNLGHGSSGWALACGSARVLADMVAGRAPAIDVEGLDVGRLQ